MSALEELSREQTAEAIVAFVGSLRAERRLYPELYADRLAQFLEEVRQEGLSKTLKRFQKELPR